MYRIVLPQAAQSLTRNVPRSGLTALGVIVGVGAVVAMLSIGDGARARVKSLLASLDADQLTASTWMPRKYWRDGRPAPVPAAEAFTLNDFAEVRRETRKLAVSTLYGARAVRLRANGRLSDAVVVGTDRAGVELLPTRLTSGASFQDLDVREARTTCILTRSLSKALFDRNVALGKRVALGSAQFTVIGVVEDQVSLGPSTSRETQSVVYIPYTSLLRRVARNPQISFALKPLNPLQAGQVRTIVNDVLERRRGNRRVEFVLGSPNDVIEVYQASAATMTSLLASVGAVSLLVGGIGIMNIMLANVAERTKEIGIRLAIGARERLILHQFLAESFVLACFGGAIGILVGIGIAYALSELNGWPFRVMPRSLAIAFFFSGMVGILFGYYPARQAARLNPIDALRMD